MKVKIKKLKFPKKLKGVMAGDVLPAAMFVLCTGNFGHAFLRIKVFIF